MQHKTLRRQLRNLELSKSTAPDLPHWVEFLKLVEAVYISQDQDRYLLERSLAISSKEMNERWDQIQAAQTSLLAAAKLSTLGEMAAGMAHEINNPLTVIHGNIQELLETLASDGDLKGAAPQLEKVVSMCERIAKIIRGLKSFARETGGDPMEASYVGTLIDDATEMCRSRFKSQSIQLKIETVPKDAWIACKPVQISQVILNLLSNAFDAIENLEERWVEIKVDTTNGVVISVTDSGKGIPVEIAEKLMQPFFTTKEVGRGTGLGLSISKGIIDAHGGKFVLNRSCPNTRFEIHFNKTERPIERLRSQN